VRRIFHIFSTLAVGGPQRRFANLVEGLEGYDHVVTAVDELYPALDLIKGTKITRHPLNLQKSSGLSFSNFKKIARALDAIKPDIVCTYNWGTIEAALVLKKRKITHFHFEDGFGPDESITRQKRKRVWLRRLALSGGNTKIIVPSQSLLGLAQKRWGFKQEKIAYIPNGINLAHFQPIARKSDDFTIGTVCALRREKNLQRLLNVFAMLPNDTKLMIVGDGPERQALEDYAVRLGLAERVKFIGHVEDASPCYRQMDVFALTSDTEQMPLGVLEAMASGLPIIATNVGDVLSMVSEENRKFVHSLGDAPALAESLLWLKNNPQTRQSIGRDNRKRAEQNYSQMSMIKAYQALFDEAAGGRG
jgi:glycosyltransferase involved in cell wall biosynthesis